MERDDEHTQPTPAPPVARTTPSVPTRGRAGRGAHPGPFRPDAHPAEEAAAPAEVTDEQRAHEREMLERGARQTGEGRIP